MGEGRPPPISSQAEAYNMETDRQRNPFGMRPARGLPHRDEIDARKEIQDQRPADSRLECQGEPPAHGPGSFPRVRMILAGTPAAIANSGTDSRTTAPAPIPAPFPAETPSSTVTRAPSPAPSPVVS